MSTLTWDQRKQSNFRKSFFAIETAFYFLQGVYLTSLIVLTDYQMAVLFGLDYGKITTIIFIIGIPTYLKMITALLSDRVSIGKFGKRKPYLVIGAIFFAVSFGLLYFFDNYSIYYIIVLLLAYIGFMFVDGTADALTVDLTPINEASRMQGFAQAGKLRRHRPCLYSRLPLSTRHRMEQLHPPDWCHRCCPSISTAPFQRDRIAKRSQKEEPRPP